MIGLKKARDIKKSTLKAANRGCRGLMGRVVTLFKISESFLPIKVENVLLLARSCRSKSVTWGENKTPEGLKKFHSFSLSNSKNVRS